MQKKPIDKNTKFRIGEFFVDPSEGSVSNSASTVRLTPKAMNVLICLAESSGSVVSRDALLDEVWPDVVVGDAVLTRCINDLRRVFGDRAKSATYIETLPKRGYRLMKLVDLGLEAESTDPSLASRSDSPAWPNIRSWLFAGSLIIGLLLAYRVSSRIDTGEFAVEARDQILVAYSSTAGDVALGQSAALAFKTALGQSKYVVVLSESDVRDALHRMEKDPNETVTRETGLELARRESAKAFVFGQLSEIGNSFLLTAEIINPETGFVLAVASQSIDHEDRLLGALDSLSEEVRRRFGESLAELGESKPLEKVITKYPEALNAYSIAVQKRLDNKATEAIDLLKHAIDIDEKFASAHSMIALLYYGTHKNRSKAEYHWAQALANEERLTARELEYAKAHSKWYSDPNEMLRAWQLFANLYPSEATGHGNAGKVLRIYFNDFNGACEAFAKAEEIRPNLWLNHYDLGYCHLGMGRFDQSLSSFRRAGELAGHYNNFGLADALIAGHRYGEASDVLFPEGMRAEGLRKPHKKVVALYLDQGLLNLTLSELDTGVDQESLSDFDKVTFSVARAAVELQFLDMSIVRGSIREGIGQSRQALASNLPFEDLPPVPQMAILVKLAARHDLEELGQSLYKEIKADNDVSSLVGLQPYLGIAHAELMIARGDFEGAEKILGDIATRYNYFQAHESLAYSYLQRKEYSLARREYNWLVEHRGQAFGESMFSLGRSINISMWAIAHFNLSHVEATTGNASKALAWCEALNENSATNSGETDIRIGCARKISEIASSD